MKRLINFIKNIDAYLPKQFEQITNKNQAQIFQKRENDEKNKRYPFFPAHLPVFDYFQMKEQLDFILQPNQFEQLYLNLIPALVFTPPEDPIKNEDQLHVSTRHILGFEGVKYPIYDINFDKKYSEVFVQAIKNENFERPKFELDNAQSVISEDVEFNSCYQTDYFGNFPPQNLMIPNRSLSVSIEDPNDVSDFFSNINTTHSHYVSGPLSTDTSMSEDFDNDSSQVLISSSIEDKKEKEEIEELEELASSFLKKINEKNGETSSESKFSMEKSLQLNFGMSTLLIKN